MNVFDSMANGTYKAPKRVLPDNKRYMLAKQIPSIPGHELIIETNYGRAVIGEPELIEAIKQLIQKHYSGLLL